MSVIESYQDLIVWKKSMQLAEEIYELTKQLPSEEKFGMVSQMRRSAVSIPSNKDVISYGKKACSLKL